jgi:hypothetical protein
VAAIGINGANMYLDNTLNARAIVAGSITAAKIATGTITSDSGVIGALGVDSLSIADHAITVPSTQSFGPIGLTGTLQPLQTFASFTLSIDTAGLVGKPITIQATAPMFISPSSSVVAAGHSFVYELLINGVVVQHLDSFVGASVTLAKSADVTGTGGVVNVPVLVRGNGDGSTPGSTYAVSGSLTAFAAKR